MLSKIGFCNNTNFLNECWYEFNYVTASTKQIRFEHLRVLIQVGKKTVNYIIVETHSVTKEPPCVINK